MKFPNSFMFVLKAWDAIVRKFLQIIDLFIKSRLEYDYSDLASILNNSQSRNTVTRTAQDRKGDIEEFNAETIEDITGIVNRVLSKFKQRKKNRKVTLRYKAYLGEQTSLSKVKKDFENLFGDYKKQWDDSEILVDVNELCAAKNTNKQEMEMHFISNDLPVREIYIKSYYERIVAMVVIFLILLAELAVNSAALGPVFGSGIKEAIPAVLVVSLFNTLIPFAFAQWISSRKTNSMLNSITTPILYGAMLVIWFYINAVLAQMKIIAELYRVNGIDYFPQQIMMESANISGFETLVSFSTLQIFIVAMIALGFSYHHGRYWRDNDPVAHRLKVIENKIIHSFKSLCRDAKDKIENINYKFDHELVFKKRNILTKQHFVSDVHDRLIVQQTQFNHFKSELINEATKLFEYAMAVHDIQNDGRMAEDVKSLAKSKLKEKLDNDLATLAINFDFDELISKRPEMIPENSLSDLKYEYMAKMDEFDRSERIKINSKEMDFTGDN